MLRVWDSLAFGLASSLWLVLFSWLAPKGSPHLLPFVVVIYGLAYAAGYRPWWALAYVPLLAAWLLLARGEAVVWMFVLYNALTYVLGGAALGRGLWRLASIAVFWLVFQLANVAVILALYPLALALQPAGTFSPYPGPESVPANAAVYALTYAIHGWAVGKLSKQEPRTLWRPLLERATRRRAGAPP